MALEPSTQSILDTIAQRALSTHAGFLQTYLGAKEAVKIEGCFVECGVAYGASAAAMAVVLKEHSDGRKFHLFDSFQGIPLAGVNDDMQPGIGVKQHDDTLPLEKRLVSSGISSSSVDQVKQHMKEWGLDSINFEYHEGWFQNTVPSFKEKIAMLRLDGDLCESTYCCLDFMYANVASGGVVIVDDYALPGARKAVIDYLATIGSVSIEKTFRYCDTGSALWIKP